MTLIDSIKPNRNKALMLAKRQLPEFICDAVNLEGINFTLPEVQTVLDGVTVGGHKLTDQTIVSNQAKAWQFVFTAVETNHFMVNKTTALAIHAIAAFEESLEPGHFRSGQVTIAGTDYLPPQATQLDILWHNMLDELDKIDDLYDRAICLFLSMARQQFFYDVNKRMGRFMMNGLLLSHGYPAINLPAKRQLEFNQRMLAFYQSADPTAMVAFMKDCLDPKLIKIMNEP